MMNEAYKKSIERLSVEMSMLCRYVALWQREKVSVDEALFSSRVPTQIGELKMKVVSSGVPGCRLSLDKRLMNIHNYTCDEHFVQMGKMLFECLFWSGRASDLKWMEEGRRNIRRIVNCITSTCDGALSSPAFLFHGLSFSGRDGRGCMSRNDVYKLFPHRRDLKSRSHMSQPATDSQFIIPAYGPACG